jgi:EF hand
MGIDNPLETKMNTFTKLSIASALMFSAAIGVAVAQDAAGPDDQGMARMDDGQHGGRHHGKHHGGKGRGMQMIDVNNDGVISQDEAASLADHGFMRMDDDGDGKLTVAEFTSGPRGNHGGWFDWNSSEKAAVEKLRQDKFAALDTNKDASLDKTEFFADAQAQLAAADADKDGKVTPWEFRAKN